MNKINYMKSACAAALILLTTAQCTTKQEPGSTSAPVAAEAGAGLRVAYVNVDSLLLNYNYAKDLNEALLRKQENSSVNINSRGRSLEKEVADFQNKVRNNAFLTEERAQQEYQRLQKAEADLNELSQRAANELMAEQQKMNAQLADTIHAFLKEFNAKAQYDFIFSNVQYDNILIANEKYDITNEVLDELNRRYQPATKN